MAGLRELQPNISEKYRELGTSAAHGDKHLFAEKMRRDSGRFLPAPTVAGDMRVIMFCFLRSACCGARVQNYFPHV